jgi:hypothetical protein
VCPTSTSGDVGLQYSLSKEEPACHVEALDSGGDSLLWRPNLLGRFQGLTYRPKLLLQLCVITVTGCGVLCCAVQDLVWQQWVMRTC